MNTQDIAFGSEYAAFKNITLNTPIEGQIIAPAATAANSPQSSIVSIEHLQNTSEIFPFLTAFYIDRYITAPWASPDGRVALDVFVDETFIHIIATSSTAGADKPATTFDYSLLPAVP